MTNLSPVQIEERVEIAVKNLIVPDIIFPEELIGPRRPSAFTGSRALMFAILEDAVRCYSRTIKNVKESEKNLLERDAKIWIESEDTERLFSFNNVCASLGLSPSALRRGLKQLKELRRARSDMETISSRMRPHIRH